MKYERETSNLLRRLGVNNSYIGFRYTIYGVIRSVHEPDLLSYISKGLYVEIAVRYKTSVGCVEPVSYTHLPDFPPPGLALPIWT